MNTEHESLIVITGASSDGSTSATMRESDYTVVGFETLEREDRDGR